MRLDCRRHQASRPRSLAGLKVMVGSLHMFASMVAGAACFSVGGAYGYYMDRLMKVAAFPVDDHATRSFELRAALSLAKLCQSTGRPVDARAVLAPALEGFAPTDEMPEIAEAQALLVAIDAGVHVRHE
jgi:hypothetical protein